jgi:hypothetical protein
VKYLLPAILLIVSAIASGEELDMPSSIRDVKSRHEARLLTLPDVVSVGIGRDENGNQAIIVGLRRSNPATESRLPTELEGYPVRIRIVGEIKAQ